MSFPILPGILADFFARQVDPELAFSCETYPINSQPLACIEGYGTVVKWAAAKSFVVQCGVCFLAYPVIGSLSDRYGRKPFLIVSMLLNIPTVATTMLHEWVGSSMYW